jgi:hypothetical protein
MKIMGKAMCNELSKPRGSIDENQTGCWQRYVVLGYERNRQYSFSDINNMVLQIISWKDNGDSLQRNQDAHLATSSNICKFNFVQSNSTFGMTITHDAIKNAESDEYQRQQCNMACQTYEVRMNIRVNGT